MDAIWLMDFIAPVHLTVGLGTHPVVISPVPDWTTGIEIFSIWHLKNKNVRVNQTRSKKKEVKVGSLERSKLTNF